MPSLSGPERPATNPSSASYHGVIIALTGACLAALLSFLLYLQAERQELESFKKNAAQEISLIQQAVRVNMESSVYALRRMARRWEVIQGTTETAWRDDARQYILHNQALTTIEWVDPTFHVRWIEPLKGNEEAIGLNIAFEPERAAILKNAVKQEQITLTPPLDLIQGYKAVIVYLPIYPEENFDGFIVGIYNTNTFFAGILPARTQKLFHIDIYDDHKTVYKSSPEITSDVQWNVTRDLDLFGRTWTIKLTPKPAFISSQSSSLPDLILIVGLITSLLLGCVLYFAFYAYRQARLLKNNTLDLATSEEQFRLALENSAIGMALVAPDGKWLKVNRALCNIVGYSENELLHIDFQTITHPDDLHKDMDCLKKMLSGEIDTYEMEKRYFHKNGDIIWILLNVSLVWNNDNTPKYFISQILDITQSKKAEDERKAHLKEMETSREEALRANIMKSEFLANMSHEIRTPLNGIIGAADLLKKYDLPLEQKKYLNVITRSGDTLLELINDILDLSKIEAGELEINPENVNLRNIMRDILHPFQITAKNKHIDLTINYIGNVPDIVALDIVRFKQIMMNLLGNAVKFVENGYIAVHVTALDITEDTAHIKFTVEDTGIGIPANKLDTIFDKFAQADSSTTKQYGGTGLGLAITERLVGMMGGKIWVESQVDIGTKFHVELPVPYTHSDENASPVAEAEAEAGTGNAPATTKTSLQNIRVLLVENEMVNQMVATDMLENMGCYVDVAENGQLAVDAVKQGKPAYDIILMDCMMPVMDGFEATINIRSYEQENSIAPHTIIAMTANAMSGEKDKCLEVGMTDYLSKPVKTQVLYDMIKKYISGA